MTPEFLFGVRRFSAHSTRANSIQWNDGAVARGPYALVAPPLVATLACHCTTPTPHPSPQRGGERAQFAAPPHPPPPPPPHRGEGSAPSLLHLFTPPRRSLRSRRPSPSRGGYQSMRHRRAHTAPPASVASHASPQAFASSRTRRM